MENEPKKLSPIISIQICTHRDMNPFFANSLRQLEANLNRNNIQYYFSNEIGVSNLCSGRQHRTDDAIKSDATHVLFLDDDMVFPPDTVQKMLDTANKLVTGFPDENGTPTREIIKKVAIGVNPCRKTMNGIYYTAKPAGSYDFMRSKGQMDVVEASRCGLSVFLIETALLRDIPSPHFEIMWGPYASRYMKSGEMYALLQEENRDESWMEKFNGIKNYIETHSNSAQETQGEDFYFIRKLTESGVRVFIDQELSHHIGHVGHYIYGYSSYGPDAPSHPLPEKKENVPQT